MAGKKCYSIRAVRLVRAKSWKLLLLQLLSLIYSFKKPKIHPKKEYELRKEENSRFAEKQKSRLPMPITMLVNGLGSKTHGDGTWPSVNISTSLSPLSKQDYLNTIVLPIDCTV
jgi:hypothetical protein